MPNEWIEKLKRFNADGGVWAIPKRNTEERKMLDRGQRFKYSLLKERFPDLSRQLEEEVTNREAKAKMRKAEELIKQAEAIEKVVTRRKLRVLPKEEEQPPPLESADAPIRPENKKKENEESKTKTDADVGNNKKSIYNKMEGMKTIEGPKTATEYYYYVKKNQIEMPKKALEQYADEQGMSKKQRMSFLNNASRSRKIQAAGYGFNTVEEFDKDNEAGYEKWLKGEDWRYVNDLDDDITFKGGKKLADENKKLRDEDILKYRKEAEEGKEV